MAGSVNVGSNPGTAAELRQVAVSSALVALDRLRSAGIDARVVGSLARGRGFGRLSDVDFLVDAPPDREYEAFRILEGAMGALPFHLLPRRRLSEGVLAHLEKEACDAATLRAREQAPR